MAQADRFFRLLFDEIVGGKVSFPA